MIQVLIPIGPRDAYFREEDYFFPKPLVDIRGKPMIERVIAPFKALRHIHDSVRFIFVAQEEDCARFSLDNVLGLITKDNAAIVKLKASTTGAVCSCLMAIDELDPDEPLIVSNSDQVIDADIAKIVHNFDAREFDAGVITFKSIHPRWSYVLSDKKGLIVQAAEKRVISDQAVAGFYYFRHARTFLDAAMKVVLNEQAMLGRYFVSETLNEIILQGGLVGQVMIPADSYHSLYAPAKVEEYEARLDQVPTMTKSTSAPNLVIPMAGEGSRFREAGYMVPKPFIDIAGKSMIERVLDNLHLPGSPTVLISRKDHLIAQPEMASRLEMRGSKLLSIDGLTEGTACTVLQARSELDMDAPLLIANCDQLIDFDCSMFVEDCIERGLDGSILVFRDDERNPKWSFARTDHNGIVLEVAEKQPISDLATVGIYFFNSTRLFVDSAIDMIAHNDRVNGEFYTCPVYNYAIRSGARIGVYEISPEAMHGLGTPEDLEFFMSLMGQLSA